MRTRVTGTTDERATDQGTPTPPDELSFDDALAELQRTIAELETGNLPPRTEGPPDCLSRRLHLLRVLHRRASHFRSGRPGPAARVSPSQRLI